MKFKYRKFNLKDPFSKRKYILRPIIPISLKNNDYVIHYEALIDSGADFCIFPLGLARKLAINLTESRIIQFSGVDNLPVTGMVGKVILKLGRLSIVTEVVFAEVTSMILGQRGFFDHFDVKLSYQKQIIEIEPLKISN